MKTAYLGMILIMKSVTGNIKKATNQKQYTKKYLLQRQIYHHPYVSVVGDAAYSSKTNIERCGKDKIDLVSKLNPSVTHGFRKEEDQFEFNKDANMYMCPAGHLAIRKERTGKKNQSTNQSLTYYFDIDKCKVCPLKMAVTKIMLKVKHIVFQLNLKLISSKWNS